MPLHAHASASFRVREELERGGALVGRRQQLGVGQLGAAEAGRVPQLAGDLGAVHGPT